MPAMRAVVLVSAVYSLALLGCAQEGGALLVEPETLELLAEGDNETLDLQNTGNGDLRVDSITITPEDVFAVTGLDLPLVMRSGDSVVVEVEKIGPEPCGERAGSIIIGWTSADQALESEVALAEASWDGEIAAEPALIQFDTTQVGERGRLELNVTNLGSCVADITDIIQSGSENYFLVERGTIDPPDTRHTLTPNEVLQWDVLFAPEAEGCHRGGIIIRTAPVGSESLTIDISGPTPAFACDQ